MEEYIFKKGDPFTLIIPGQCLEKGDVIVSGDGTKIEILGTPKLYTKWYQKVIRWVSRGRFFTDRYSHLVRTI